MKTSKVAFLMVVLICALLTSDANAMNQWLYNYLTGMDQLMMIPWKYIFYYTWLILPRWILCTWFNDLGLKYVLTDVNKSSSDSEMKATCEDGVKDYFEAVYYGGDPDYGVYAYFRSFKKD